MDIDKSRSRSKVLRAEQALDAVLAANPGAQACLTSSFQAEDMAVAHLLRQRIPDVPVLFLETGYHFAQTYEYRDRMTQGMVAESGERDAGANGGGAGVGVREFCISAIRRGAASCGKSSR